MDIESGSYQIGVLVGIHAVMAGNVNYLYEAIHYLIRTSMTSCRKGHAITSSPREHE